MQLQLNPVEVSSHLPPFRQMSGVQGITSGNNNNDNISNLHLNIANKSDITLICWPYGYTVVIAVAIEVALSVNIIIANRNPSNTQTSEL